jgi:hypothetical protein
MACLLSAALFGCSALLDSGPIPLDGDVPGEPDAWDVEADDAAPDRPDGVDLQDRPDETLPETQDLADMEDAADTMDVEPDGPCIRTELCGNRIDDDGDGSIDEGCSMSLKFTDGSPPPNTWVDVVFTADRSYDCVRLFITPPSAASFTVDQSISDVFFGSYFKWNFQVEIPGDTGDHQIDVIDCSSGTFTIMTGTLRVDGTLDDCDGMDNDGDGRVDENCVDSIRFTDFNPWPGDIVDVVVTNHTALACIHLQEQDPCTGTRNITDSMDTGEGWEPYTVWDYTVELPGRGGTYIYTFRYQTCSEACDCEEMLAAGADYAVCGTPGC